MTQKPKLNALSRRERQIMDILYKLERASVGQVLAEIAGKPSYSTVRAQLRVLEEKGHVRHEEHGLRYVYVPAVPREVARRSALRHLVETFFDGSTEKVVAALLGGEVARISPEELDRIARLDFKPMLDDFAKHTGGETGKPDAPQPWLHFCQPEMRLRVEPPLGQAGLKARTLIRNDVGGVVVHASVWLYSQVCGLS